MPVTELKLSNIGPFDEIELTFDRQVNILTGPNNTGKSTILWALGELLVFPFTLPERSLKDPTSTWQIRMTSNDNIYNFSGSFPVDITDDLIEAYKAIGYTCYIPGQRYSTDFRSPGPGSARDLDVHIDAHLELISQARPSLVHRMPPAELRSFLHRAQQQEDPELSKRTRLLLSAPLLLSNHTLIQKIIDLDYASLRLNRPEIRQVFGSVISIASDITEGFPLEFAGIGEDNRGLYPKVKTLTEELPMDSLSQGTMSVIHCLAQLIFGYAEYYDFPEDLATRPGTVIIDEIDAHLHPSWQRRIIPTLTDHFPNLQIFCSTHSPLMLAGLEAQQVHLLRQDASGGISVSPSPSDIFGWTADEILRHIFGLPEPTDLSTTQSLQRLASLRRRRDLSAAEREELECLRARVGTQIMNAPMAAEIARMASEVQEAIARPDDSASGSGREGDDSPDGSRP
ncbi:MAG: AAA family ATPase [Chloroflexi bacterium]|nr:AAA family ATPase [Chloroflexota bacterium]